MEKAGIAVRIVRFVDASQPGWVECEFNDAHGRRWLFVEKVPIVTHELLDANCHFPRDGAIACEAIEQGVEVARVDTSRPCDIASVEGETEFVIPLALLLRW